ncbi:hypothetical protein [Altererythrobacter sp. B11]|uniref:hypothetical protein n=1 Tax=Altererythrobacter sp. B11 TaxID=2060312 RepID=UPI0011AE45B9|nr:hypothetical protein [Altererythrobacter sp. B11]
MMALCGVLAACGGADAEESGVSAVAEAGSAADPGTVADDDAEEPSSAPAVPAEAPGQASGEAAPHAEGAKASLPLKLGFYIADDTSCGNASNATLMLLRKGGLNTSRVPCDFTRIEKTGPDRYRVSESCSEGGEAWGTEEHVYTNISTYRVDSETRFTIIGDGGEQTVKHCPQSSLPEPWRDNDIASIVSD